MLFRVGLIRCDDGRPYLWRMVVAERVRLHLFLHGDHGCPHDHPFEFWAIALFGTAVEEVRWCAGEEIEALTGTRTGLGTIQRRIWPLVWRRYTATTAHRILRPRLLLTLVVNGPYVRKWGFWRGGEFVPHSLMGDARS